MEGADDTDGAKDVEGFDDGGADEIEGFDDGVDVHGELRGSQIGSASS